MKEKNIIGKPLTISVVGKGGSGKTAITTLLAKSISKNYNYKMLLIDADPTHPHLSHMVGLVPQKSLEQLRIDVIDKVLTNAKSYEEVAENIDFEVYNAITESKDFSLFSIGQPEGPGCFCPSNTLLRKVISSISKDFDIVLIDCEAGLEQINRMVIETVDILLIVSDISIRSVETAATISKSAVFSYYDVSAVKHAVYKLAGPLTTLDYTTKVASSSWTRLDSIILPGAASTLFPPPFGTAKPVT